MASPTDDLITQASPEGTFSSRPARKSTKRRPNDSDADPNAITAPPTADRAAAGAVSAGGPAQNPAKGTGEPASVDRTADAKGAVATAGPGETASTLLPNPPSAKASTDETAGPRDTNGRSDGSPNKPGRHQAEAMSAGEKMKTNQTTSSSSLTKTKKSRGFWSRFFASLSCTTVDKMDSSLELDQVPGHKKNPADDSSDTGSAGANLKKADQKSTVHVVEPSASTVVAAHAPAKDESGATGDANAPSSPAAAIFSPAVNDPAAVVIVPPSPKAHTLPKSETEGVTSGAVQAPGSTGEEEESSDGSGFTDDEGDEHKADELEDEEDRLILSGGVGIPIGPDGQPRPLLPPLAPEHAGRKCLVLDLDETLLHSSFRLIPQADYVIPVEIEWQWHNVYVIKRPGVDNFLKRMGELYEVVVFTASLSKYADPVLDKLDVHKVVSHRLFRESCYSHKGNYVKDLSQLGRPMQSTIILDNSPASYIFHPNNAVPVSSWFNDPHDTELTDLCPFLADLRTVDDVRGVLDGGL